jgi:hypothetical protein
MDLMTRLMEEFAPRGAASAALPASAWGYRRDDVEAALVGAGLHFRAWEFRQRLTQLAYARWLSIPVMTDGLWPGVDPAERDRRIARALDAVDRHSFKWERWRGWTAWRA